MLRSRKFSVLVGIAVLLTILLAPTVRAYVHQRSQIGALREQVATQRVTVSELQKEQVRWTDNAYVEQQARERLKFVKVGEKSYTVIDAGPADQSDGTLASAPAASSNHPWYGRLWESAQVADAPAAAGR